MFEKDPDYACAPSGLRLLRRNDVEMARLTTTQFELSIKLSSNRFNSLVDLSP